MSLKKTETVHNGQLKTIAFFLIIDTLIRATWHRKNNGILGLIRYPKFLLKNLIRPIFGFLLPTWRTKIFLAANAWFRRVDDVMDEDAKPPKGYTKKSYLIQKQTIIASLPDIKKCSAPLLMEDFLILYLLRETERHGIDISEEMRDLWLVMCWDDERRMNKSPATTEAMTYYATIQDTAYLSAIVKILGGDSQEFHTISRLPAGLFTKTDWLCDLYHDLSNGALNIPIETITEHGWELSKLMACTSWEELRKMPNFAQWCVEEAEMLKNQWINVKTIINQNISRIFSSQLLPSFFYKLILRPMERMYIRRLNRTIAYMKHETD